MMQDFVHTIQKTQTSYRQIIQRKLREHNIELTFEMLYILRHLSSHDRINQQELSNLTFKDKSSLSYLITNMGKRGLIERSENVNDKRSKLIILTDKGRALFLRVRIIVDVEYAKIEQEIDQERMQLCITYMKQIKQIIKNIK